VPNLILSAFGLLAVEDRLRNWLIGRTDHGETVSHHNTWTMLAVFLASI